MKEFTVIYRNGDSKDITVEGRDTLIREYFDDSEERFANEVIRLIWHGPTTEYIEDVMSGQLYAQISTADVNPYGWRG